MEERPVEVVIRMRPSVANEELLPADSFYMIESEGVFIFKDIRFAFEKVFPPHVSNRRIYNIVAAQRIKQVVEGFNVTILAYGSTGSGKTYTMGATSNDDPGLIPLGLQDIFETAAALKNEIDITVKISFYELYMEQIFDLLQDKTKKPNCYIQGEKGNLKVVNLVEKTINSPEEGILLLERGSKARKTECTAKNATSSRSHAIFTVTVTSVEKATNITKKAKFQLVDLAGSERQKTSKTEGIHLKEGITINQALTSLARVITSLAQRSKHIPYRDSVLTKILQDTFGGNSYSVMIACVSPAKSSENESLSTLRYADQTQKVKNRPIVNKETKEKLIESLKRQISWYESELAQYRSDKDPQSLSSYESNMNFFKMTVKVANLSERLTKAEESRKKIAEKTIEICNSIKSVIDRLTSENITDRFLKDFVGKIEVIQEEILKLIDQDNLASGLNTPDISVISPNVSLTLSGELNPPLSETGSDNIAEKQDESVTNEDKKRHHAENVAQMEILDNTIMIKESQAEACGKFSDLYNIAYNEEAHKELLAKISTLVEEKNCLLEKNDNLLKSQEMKDKFAKEKEERIRALELEIKHLQDALERSKVLLQLKKRNKEKEESLLREIQLHKNSKAQLIKQMKNDAMKQQRKIQEESKRVAVLEKQQRQSEVKLAKLQSNFEKQVKVLQHRVDTAQAARKRVTQPSKLKEAKTDAAKIEHPVVDTVDAIEELLSQAILQEQLKDKVEIYEKEVDYLEGQIHSLEDLKEGLVTDAELESQESQSEETKNTLSKLKNAISEMRQGIKVDTSDEIQQWSFLKSLPQAKKAIEHLFKKCIHFESEKIVETMQHEEKSKEMKEIVSSLNSQIDKFVNRVEQLERDIKNKELAIMKQKSSLECEWESKIFSMIELAKDMPKSESKRTDSPVVQHLKALAEGDKFKKLYEEKCEEVAKLQEKVSKVSKTKKTYLPTLSADGKKPKLDDEKISGKIDMTSEFLNDPEDSFSIKEDDDKDPDFRGTPLHLRRTLKRKPTEGVEALHPSTPKKINTGCKCPNDTDCSTKRCCCFRRKLVCTLMCECNKASCQNYASCSEQDFCIV